MEHRIQHDVLYVAIRQDVLSTGVRDLFDKLHALQKDPQVQQSSWRTLELDLTGTKMIDAMGLNFSCRFSSWRRRETQKPRF